MACFIVLILDAGLAGYQLLVVICCGSKARRREDLAGFVGKCWRRSEVQCHKVKPTLE